MQRKVLMIAAMVWYCFLLPVSVASTADLVAAAEEEVCPSTPSPAEKAIEDECCRLQNLFREKNRRSALDFDEGLYLMAHKHSEDMLRRNYFSHYSPEGYGPEERRTAFYPRLLGGVGENLFTLSGMCLSKSAAEIAAIIVDGWEHSPGHRKNMLDADFTHASIGVKLSGNHLTATCDFASEVAVLDKQLPKAAPIGARFTVTGEVRGRVTLTSIAAFLNVPDASARFEVPDQPNAYSTGGCFLKVQPLSKDRFRLCFDLDKGPGNYEFLLGENRDGRHSFYPGWKLQAR